MRIVIVGAGDAGLYLARQLSAAGEEVVLVDPSTEQLGRAEEEADILTLCGDATHRSVLRAAEVDRSDLVVAISGQDEVNLVAAALSTSIGARRSVARVDAPSFYATDTSIEYGVLGIHALLCASRLVSDELLRLVEQTHASTVSYCAGNTLSVVVAPLHEEAAAIGKNPSDLALGPNVTVAAVVRDSVLRRTEEHVRLEAHDELLLAGPAADASTALRKVQGRRSGRRRAVIVGGGNVGYQLAERLRDGGTPVQIIEIDRQRCERLAAALPGVNVVHGDGTSIGVLSDQQVGVADFLVAVTRGDEVNLMASLMARDLGLERTFALVHRPGYASVYDHLGITGTAGPHLVVGAMVDWLTPRAALLTHKPLGTTGYALAELQIPASYAGRLNLRQTPFPANVIVLGVVRPTVGPLSLDTPLLVDDTVVLAVPQHAIKETERAIMLAAKQGGS